MKHSIPYYHIIRYVFERNNIILLPLVEVYRTILEWLFKCLRTYVAALIRERDEQHYFRNTICFTRRSVITIIARSGNIMHLRGNIIRKSNGIDETEKTYAKTVNLSVRRQRQ